MEVDPPFGKANWKDDDSDQESTHSGDEKSPTPKNLADTSTVAPYIEETSATTTP
jgi:hypothetical protein